MAADVPDRGGFPSAVLFDLDGTLLDSAPDMLATVNRMRAARGAGPMALDALRPVVSKGARAMSAVAFPEILPQRLPDLVPEFLDIYRQELGRHSRPFDGVEEMLEALEAAGTVWGIVTNKPEYLAREILPQLGWQSRCAVLVGGDSLSLEFWRALRNTFLLSFYGLCFGFPMPVILALFFNEIRSNVVRSTCQVLTYLPKFMSTVVMTSLVTMLVKQGAITTGYGIISQALEALGIISTETAKAGLLNNPDFFRAIYQISGIWEGAGYDSIVYFAAIIAISPTSYEAAQIDGAGKMAQMRYVVLPGILSTLVIMLITRIGSLLNIGYEKVLLLYNTNTYVTADVVSTFAQRKGILGGQKGLASAAEMMNNVISMLLVISANTIARKASDTSLY